MTLEQAEAAYSKLLNQRLKGEPVNVEEMRRLQLLIAKLKGERLGA